MMMRLTRRMIIIMVSMMASMLMITSSQAHSHQVEESQAGQGCQQFADYRDPTFLNHIPFHSTVRYHYQHCQRKPTFLNDILSFHRDLIRVIFPRTGENRPHNHIHLDYILQLNKENHLQPWLTHSSAAPHWSSPMSSSSPSTSSSLSSFLSSPPSNF